MCLTERGHEEDLLSRSESYIYVQNDRVSFQFAAKCFVSSGPLVFWYITVRLMG